MNAAVRGAVIVTLLPASVQWLRLKLEDRGFRVTIRTVQRDLAGMERAGIVLRDGKPCVLSRWRRAR